MATESSRPSRKYGPASTTNDVCARKFPWPSSHHTGAASRYSAPVR